VAEVADGLATLLELAVLVVVVLVLPTLEQKQQVALPTLVAVAEVGAQTLPRMAVVVMVAQVSSSSVTRQQTPLVYR
jgi:hypothetical protein